MIKTHPITNLISFRNCKLILLLLSKWHDFEYENTHNRFAPIFIRSIKQPRIIYPREVDNILRYKMAGIGGQVMKNAASIMFPRNSHSIFRYLLFNSIGKRCKFSTSTVEQESEPDPAPLFFNNEVQQILKTLTRPDPKIVFRMRKEGNQVTNPSYKFMTDEELKAEMARARQRMEDALQMPPVVKKRAPITSILSKDPALQGHDTSKFVFTDITYGVSDSDRIIVVRETDGLLRNANWDERFRMNQIYFPTLGRKINAPKMFQDEYLQDLIKREEYEFILDRACVQYDPNDPEFHRVTTTVYEAINNCSHFDRLRSTRHYGPLVFHLVWTKNINNLLIENIQKELLEDAALLIQLYNKVYPTSKSAGVEHDGDHLKFIQHYIDTESPIRGKLTAFLNSYKELVATRKATEEGVKKAHGLT